mgnify:CR=1 FL=1
MNFIISIGGSGSKCMESLIYLMAAKFLPSTEPYRVFVVDKAAIPTAAGTPSAVTIL